MKDLLIVGASGFGRELLQWCKDINKIEKKWNIKGFLDDNIDALKDTPCDYKVIGRIHDYHPTSNDVFAIAVADPRSKKMVVELLESKGAEFISIIHPDACVGEFNKLGKGIILYPTARVTVNAELGDFVVVLDRSTVGHDAKVGKYSTICGCSSINGHVEIGKEVFIANSVSIVPSRKIEDGAYVGAGSVVVNNVKEGTKVFGVPAKKISL